jgi:hypothetical protein
MTAREMFTWLGYEQHICEDAYICYERKNEFNERICIEFYLKRRTFYASCGKYPHEITTDEFIAIDMQIKELGW